MLDLKWIRENQSAVKKAIEEKLVGLDLDQLLASDQKVLKLQHQLQELQSQRNQNAKSIPKASNEERPALIAKGKEIGQQISDLKPATDEAEAELKNLLLLVPNIPSPEAPRGKSEEDNVEVKKWGELPTFDFEPLHHVDILNNRGWAQFERIAKVAGTRSYALCNEAALLEQAILRMAQEKLVAKGFNLVSVPSFVGEAPLVGTGHFPTGRDQVYYLEKDDKFLAGTSEVTINSLHAGEMLNEDQLPLLYAGYSACFRREAGSAGKDTRGLIRVHQFYKVEQFVLCKNDPEESKKWHHQLLSTSEEVLQDLEIPYRVVECCTGDMGAGKYRMHDIEAWVPSEETYRETHSCSSLHDWQARRTGLRYRNAEKKPTFCHTLNNTAVATPRMLVPFLENHQQKDGKVRVPEKLRPFLGGREVL
jgi:seryl-tRNA synthetase